MTLTREFRETIMARAQSDAAFREALLTEAMNDFLADDIETGKSTLRDYINATLGFEELARELGKSAKSVHRMLAPSGNPNARNLFAILRVLQDREGVSLEVSAAHRAA